MISDTVDWRKFGMGFAYGLSAQVILTLILGLIWWITQKTLTTFPILLLSFGLGGIYMTVGGCIGPGRYQKQYNLLLYTPISGSSFSDEFVVSAFVVDTSISKADIIINNNKVQTLEFDPETHTAEVTLSRKDFINSALNTIYLKAGEHKSNTNDFVLFEYTEDMTDEELDEFYEIETQQPEKTLKEAKSSYVEKINNRTGSIAFGLAILGLLNISLSFIVELLTPLFV